MTTNIKNKKAIYLFVIAAILLIIGYSFDVVERYQKKQEKQLDSLKITSNVPTKCDLSIPVPKTTVNYEGQTYSWKFSEKVLKPDSFYPLDENNQDVQVSALQFKGNEDSTDFASFLLFCIDNTENYTEEEYLSLVKVNKKYPITTGKKTVLGRGEVDFNEITLSNIQGTNGVYDETGIIGLSQNKEKLLYIVMFAGDPSKSFADQLNEDISLMQKNIQYR